MITVTEDLLFVVSSYVQSYARENRGCNVHTSTQATFRPDIHDCSKEDHKSALEMDQKNRRVEYK